jgi:energy-coupling factor transporter ATP-binding protein EcfA2
MRLKYANIVNFRSIQDVQVDFEPSCRTLVGINESGKSNVLRALSMIGSEFVPVPEDVREPLPREKSISKAYIRFVFSFDRADTDEIYSAVKKKTLSSSSNGALLTSRSKKLTLHNFVTSRDEGLYIVDVIAQTKRSTYWAASDELAVPGNWKKPSPACPADYAVDVGGAPALLNDFSLVNTDEYPEIPSEYLTSIDAKHVFTVVGEGQNRRVENVLPRSIVWRYDEQNLVPPVVNIDTFVANPDSCVPLKNMFMLAGVTDIAGEVANARKVSANKVRNLLRRVASHTTSHFRSVWKEYKEISFALEPNGDTIEANIVEKNYWKMSQRSDGVKRFITFLLYISANIKANLLTNSLLLIDEPDIGLHPSGSRYLRDELIENAKKNYVVFSTHSIFMIDKENIARHIIVKKEEEETTIINANKSNFVDEEVLFNALNYTVFDILKKDNIIFEGWRDKKLFQTAVAKMPASHSADLKPLKDKLKSLGLCHAEGVKDIRNIAPLLELANRNCLIVSDADAPAKEKQKEYLAIRGYGIWKRYDEVMIGTRAETAEDFITEQAFKGALAKMKSKHAVMTGELVMT